MSALPTRFVAVVHKAVGVHLGASFGNISTGVVIISVQDGGLIDTWNKENPSMALKPGFIIEEANGVQGYWNILDVVRKPGTLVFQVSTVPPASAGPDWFEQIASMAKTVEQSAHKGSFMVRLQSQSPNSKDKESLITLPTLKASACGTDQCAVCLEKVEPDEMLSQLPCKHAFHALCTAHWLSKNNLCPLCRKKMVCTPEGEVHAVDTTGGCAIGGSFSHLDDLL